MTDIVTLEPSVLGQQRRSPLKIRRESDVSLTSRVTYLKEHLACQLAPIVLQSGLSTLRQLDFNQPKK